MELSPNFQEKSVDKALFVRMMEACLSQTVDVLEKQYQRYFITDLTEKLRKETESTRCHNIDAEEIMGMFSAAKEWAPRNATMCHLSSRIRAQKNNVVDYLDNLKSEKRQKLIELAITLGRKQRQERKKKSGEIKAEFLNDWQTKSRRRQK